MKKLILITGLLSLFGCAFLQSQKANWEACKADVECSEKAEAWKDKGELAGELVTTGVATVVPGVAVAIKPVGSVVGYTAFALAMLLGGAAVLKKKKEETPVE